ncbi:zinc-ribbon domain-containing protein [Roseovarius aestuariivivens]|uniref:zinc-ribbon domain-containing protein n=1 Tax=Roseovarius aestuariivivens TaxID=1888910 RepID=UPI0010801F98|nr:zinc-ribbon domain-containing protein [Roseovarius aestuariivivens]
MRLICPNCGAQYEVPDEVIPESGRDVQCSDCGDTWFQYHPDYPPDPEEMAQDTAPDWTEAATEEPDPAPEPEPASEPEPERAAEPDPEPELERDPEEDAVWAMQAPDDGPYDDEDVFAMDDTAESAAPARRELDPSIRDLLREEAEREEQARQSEMRGGVETQQELGIDAGESEAERRNQEARARMARLRGLPDTDPDAEDDDIDPASRRNLLPDIEEINSSLGPERVEAEKSRAAAQDADAQIEPPEKTGFRRGFRIAIVASVLALLLYAFAPRLAESVPALTGPLAGYVDLVNSGRMALAEMVENLAGALGEGEVQ